MSRGKKKGQEKNMTCLDCHETWRDGGGEHCPFCGSTDIGHLA